MALLHRPRSPILFSGTALLPHHNVVNANEQPRQSFFSFKSHYGQLWLTVVKSKMHATYFVPHSETQSKHHKIRGAPYNEGQLQSLAPRYHASRNELTRPFS